MIARLFRSDAMAEKLGEAEDFFIDEGSDSYQLTYDSLRDMDGETLAVFDPSADWWLCLKNGVTYSDIVLHNHPAESS